MLHVICFGNYWQGDDGFGIHVLRRLRRMSPLLGVDLFDAGTAGLSALGHFEGCRKAVIVDAVKSGGPVGRVHRVRCEDVDWPDSELSVHAIGVNHLVAALPVVFEGGPMPEVVVIGAEIGEIQPFTDALTLQVEAAVEVAAGLVRGECESWARELRVACAERPERTNRMLNVRAVNPRRRTRRKGGRRPRC
jgi:hydrogenase maturation protease